MHYFLYNCIDVASGAFRVLYKGGAKQMLRNFGGGGGGEATYLGIL